MKGYTHRPPLSRILLLLLLLKEVKPNLLEEQVIYLVLLDGEAMAFRQGNETSTQQQQRQRFHLESYNVFSESYKKQVIESHDRLLASTLDFAAYRKLYSFHHIVNGFAVHTTPSQAERLRMVPEVLMLEKDRGTKLMTTYTPHLLDLPRGVWPQEGGQEHAGEGIVIGVVDTGIDPTHPSFAYDPLNPGGSNRSSPFLVGVCDVGARFPHGSCNGKIISARYFAQGAAAAALPLDASRDLSPFDVVGHGSHVASIAAGNWGVPVVVNGFMYGFASGMAPRARIAVYKAIYPAGGSVADLVAAIDQAAQDRVDVIVLSVGPDEPPVDVLTFMNVFDISLLFARRAGIFVAQAAGNKGPGEASVVSFSPWAMGVAASSTGRSYNPTLVLGDAHQIHGVGLSAPTPGDGLFQFRLMSARDAAQQDLSKHAMPQYAEECQHPDALQPALVLGSIVICSFSEGFFNGTSTVTAILDTANSLGFLGFVLVANASYGDFVADPLPFPLPGIMIPRVDDAQTIWEYYENQTHRDTLGVVISYGGTAAIREGRSYTLTEAAPTVARFSSRGPDIIDSQLNPADVLKPDVVAPGQEIWAAWSPLSVLNPILSGNHFALLSGTSMAAPHVAGVAALVKHLHRSWTPAMIASAVSTTATKHDKLGNPIMSQGSLLYSVYPSTPFDYGAGFVNPWRAIDPGLVLPSEFEDYINFLCSLRDLNPGEILVATGVRCNVSLDSPADLNLPSITISALRGYQSVRRNVKNVASKAETYLCSVLPPEGVTVGVQPPWFTVAPEGAQHLEIVFNVTKGSNSFSFGEIVLTGSLNHIVRLPLAVLPIAMS
ncbi:subtilisin-like protease SBT2.4 [Typha angustifolia]|uniref:subtilisin-like protease SBT2.4 n=1 Tax=Typha angustifolia TaxID=59011 RepID=UPI003C2D2ED9